MDSLKKNYESLMKRIKKIFAILLSHWIQMEIPGYLG